MCREKQVPDHLDKTLCMETGFLYSYKSLFSRKVLIKKIIKKGGGEVVMGTMKTALCSWDEGFWEWMYFHLWGGISGYRNVFSFPLKFSGLLMYYIIQEEGAKVAVVIHVSPSKIQCSRDESPSGTRSYQSFVSCLPWLVWPFTRHLLPTCIQDTVIV